MKKSIVTFLLLGSFLFAQEFTMELNGTSTSQGGITVSFSTGSFVNSSDGTNMSTYAGHPYGTPINGGNDYKDLTVSPATYIAKITVAWATNTQGFQLQFLRNSSIVKTLGDFNSSGNIQTPTEFNVAETVDAIRFYDTGVSSNGGFELSHITFNGSLPVELTSFVGNVTNNQILLAWQTATEVNNYGFEIERNINNIWGKIGFVEGHGNSNSEKNYSFQDSPNSDGVYSYRLKQIDFDGKFEYSSVVEVDFRIVTDFALEQNYPNPFNPTTSISYSLAQNEFVTLKVYDVIGNEVATLVNTLQESGKHEVNFNASNLSSGIYFYKLTAGSFSQINKMMLVK